MSTSLKTAAAAPAQAARPALSLADAQTFLYREAQLADEHRFDEWLALWDDSDILYWIPAGSDDIDPKRHISIAYDNRARLEDRIYRLQSTGAGAQRPRSRMRRLVSNVVIESDDGWWSGGHDRGYGVDTGP